MFQSVFLSLQLYVTIAFPFQSGEPANVGSTNLLRGSQSQSSGVDSNVVLKPAYYAKECVDCFYKGAQCGCGPAMDYLACLTKHCYESNHSKFMTMCAVVRNHCSAELDIDCRGPDTVCSGKYQQLSSGGPGLSWDPTASFDNAFCGPYGHCIGELKMHVNIHNRPTAQQWQRIHDVGPTPTKKPCDKEKNSKSPPEPEPVVPWLECGLPIMINANIDKKEEWMICTQEAQADQVGCDIPVSQLAPEKVFEGYCALTNGQGGARLTQPLWRSIKNPNKAIAQPGFTAQSAAPDLKNSKVIDATGKSIDNMGEGLDEAAESDLPWMKDKGRRPEPPGKKIVRETHDLTSGTRQHVTKVAKKGKEEVDAEVNEMAEEAHEAQKPIDKEVNATAEELEHGAEVTGTAIDKSVDQAHKDVSKDAEKVADETGEIAQEVEEKADEAKKTKPPYMQDDAEKKAPLPGPGDIVVSAVVQSPVMPQFA